ncbi:MAG: hypothetical protein H7281_13615 [Bacteriovorax sp.]|jgi:hypothetical protein|nr:hypothetical protein [Bacteriovorax sp.]
MDILKEDINRELNRIKEKIDKATALNEEDLKIVLLSMLNEEDLHESKQ